MSSYKCSITPETAKVSSGHSHMRGLGICHWFSDLSNGSHWSFEAAVLQIYPNNYIDQCEPLYTILYHYWSLCSYATLGADILLITVVQGVGNRCWDLCCHHCYRICICWVCSNRIYRFLRWLGQLSTVLTCMVSFNPPSIEQEVGGASILRLFRKTREGHENDSRPLIGSLTTFVYIDIN